MTAFPSAPAKFQFHDLSLRALRRETPEKARSARCILQRFLRHRAAVTLKAAIKCLVFILHETKTRTCYGHTGKFPGVSFPRCPSAREGKGREGAVRAGGGRRGGSARWRSERPGPPAVSARGTERGPAQRGRRRWRRSLGLVPAPLRAGRREGSGGRSGAQALNSRSR